MKLFIKTWTIFCLLLLGTTALKSQVPDYIRTAPGAKEYPNADGLLLKQEITLTLQPDGQVEQHYFSATKALTENYLSRHSDPVINLNKESQILEILQSRTYMRDGKAVDTQANGINEITPFELEAAPDYTQMRQIIATHVGVEHYSTNVLSYKITDRDASQVPFTGILDLQASIPILEQKIMIRVPKDQMLQIRVLNSALQPIKTRVDEFDVYTLARQNVPASNISENPGQRQDYLPQLVFSTSQDWAALKTEVAARVNRAIIPNEIIKKKVTELVKTATNRIEQLDRVHEFVATRINTIHWPVRDFKWQARAAADVYSAGYGHNLDKAVLLSAMLRVLEIENHLELVSSRRVWAPDVASLDQLDQIWIVADVDGESHWLNPTATLDQQSMLDIHGVTLSLLPGASPIPTLCDQRALNHRYWATGAIRLTPGPDTLSVSGNISIEASGSYSPFIRLAQKEKSQKKMAASFAETLFHSQVKTLTVPELGTFSGSLKADLVDGKIPVKPGVPIVLSLPLPTQQGLASRSFANSGRNQMTVPIFIAAPMEEYLFLTVELPKTLKAIWVPAPVRIENSVGMVLITAKSEENAIHFEEILHIKQTKITPDLYSEFRQLLTVWLTESNRTLLLQQKQ